MRRYDEDIEVACDMVDGRYQPVKFCRSHRWWRIGEVFSKWVETADWWRSGSVDPDGDMLGEEEVYRVGARPVDGGSDGVYELARSWSGSWRLRGVMD
ncbi:MAG: hypothetical protein LBR21_04980 [Propionibacteriaceae bacterium]|jgi:hypothetical protein|nr:hypothetical protein [Propionibacteriaceae bacterium]